MTALPRVRMECALVTGVMEIGLVAVVRLVPLSTTYARASGAAEPAALGGAVEDEAPARLPTACVGCTGAAVLVS